MSLSPEVQEAVDSFLSTKGLRRTRPRQVIIEAAFRDEEHFTAEQLWERSRRLDPTTSRSTVYRTLSLLVEGGLLREIDLGKDVTYYDPNFLDHPNHNHLVCIDCGHVVEFADAHMQVLEECITRRLGFRAVKSSLRIEACCDQLRRRGTCPHLLEARLQKGQV